MSEGAAKVQSKDIGGRLDSEKSKDIRQSNIVAAKAVADVVRTSLGPRGMDKMIQDGKG
jgi:T-complex protein 1 subunit delta